MGCVVTEEGGMKQKSEKSAGRKIKTPNSYFPGYNKLNKEYKSVYRVFSENTLKDLSKTDAWKYFEENIDAVKMSLQTFFKTIDKLEQDGIVKKNKYNKYSPANPPPLADRYAPGFYIKNDNFHTFMPVILDVNRCIHFYEMDTKEDNQPEGISKKNLPELNKLAEEIKKSVEKFQSKTGMKSRMVVFTDRGIDKRDVVSYVSGKLYLSERVHDIIYNDHQISNIKRRQIMENVPDFLEKLLINVLRHAIVKHLSLIREDILKNIQIETEIQRYPIKIRSNPGLQSTYSRIIYDSDQRMEKSKFSLLLIDEKIKKMKKAHPWKVCNVANYEINFSIEALDGAIGDVLESSLQDLKKKLFDI
jgi:ribosomal protein S20